MKNRLKNAFSLLNCTNIDILIGQFLAYSLPRSTFSALIVSLINKTENRLESWSIDINGQIEKKHLDVDISDADNPLIQLLTQGRPVLWPELHQGSYIENSALQHFIALQPAHSGLYSRPLTDLRNKPCGMIIMIGQEMDESVYEQGIFPIYCNLLHHQLKSILGLSQSQQKIAHLQYLLRLQKEKEEQISATLLDFPPSIANLSPSLIHFSDISDLTLATERYEEAILRHYQIESHDNLNVMAESLNLSKRALIYKLKKYGCL